MVGLRGYSSTRCPVLRKPRGAQPAGLCIPCELDFNKFDALSLLLFPLPSFSFHSLSRSRARGCFWGPPRFSSFFLFFSSRFSGKNKKGLLLQTITTIYTYYGERDGSRAAPSERNSVESTLSPRVATCLPLIRTPKCILSFWRALAAPARPRVSRLCRILEKRKARPAGAYSHATWPGRINAPAARAAAASFLLGL